MKSDCPLVSVVIPCYNGLNNIENCLRSALKSKYSNFEIIVVDDFSVDGTYEYLQKEFSKHPKIIIIRNEKNFGPSRTRNHGIEAANGKYLAFIETDMEVDPSWLIYLIRALEEDKRLGAVQSKILDIIHRDKIHSMGVKYNPHTFWVISPGCGFNKDYIPDDLKLGIGSVGSVIRKNVLDRIGGFDEMLVHNTDDTELGWRIWLAGYNCLSVPESITYHYTAKPSLLRANVTPVFSSEFHFHKNSRILLKNYEWCNVFRFMPWLFLAYTLRVLKNLAQGNTVPMRAYFKVFVWSIINLRDTLKERRRIQSLRKRSDQEMFTKLGIEGNLFQFYFNYVTPSLSRVKQVFGNKKASKKIRKLKCRE